MIYILTENPTIGRIVIINDILGKSAKNAKISQPAEKIAAVIIMRREQLCIIVMYDFVYQVTHATHLRL